MDRKDIKGLAAKKYNVETDNSKLQPHGSGIFFKQMIREALEKKLPLYKNKDILNKLSGMKLAEEVPPEIICAAINILAYIDSMDAIERMDSH